MRSEDSSPTMQSHAVESSVEIAQFGFLLFLRHSCYHYLSFMSRCHKRYLLT